MTLTLDFAPEEEALIRERATASGKDMLTFAREAVLEKAGPTLLEFLRPIHAATERCATSVEEIDALADRAKEESRRERKLGQGAANTVTKGPRVIFDCNIYFQSLL